MYLRSETNSAKELQIFISQKYKTCSTVGNFCNIRSQLFLIKRCRSSAINYEVIKYKEKCKPQTRLLKSDIAFKEINLNQSRC
jgi:hypothetical protein